MNGCHAPFIHLPDVLNVKAVVGIRNGEMPKIGEIKEDKATRTAYYTIRS